jgi:hypothetical protein
MVKVKDSPSKLTDFKLLSFDVYSTLIDEKGIFPLSHNIYLYEFIHLFIRSSSTESIHLYSHMIYHSQPFHISRVRML